jgi:hypothetical protein
MIGIMRSILLFLVTTALLPGCGSGNASNGTQPPTPANQSTGAPANQSTGAPAQANQAAVELTPAWLAGRWQAGEGSCGAGDTFFTLEPDGRYALAEEQGRWTLNDDRLTVEVTQASPDSGTEAGQRSTVLVRPVGPNEAEFVPEGRPPIRVVRCPAPQG